MTICWLSAVLIEQIIKRSKKYFLMEPIVNSISHNKDSFSKERREGCKKQKCAIYVGGGLTTHLMAKVFVLFANPSLIVYVVQFLLT